MIYHKEISYFTHLNYGRNCKIDKEATGRQKLDLYSLIIKPENRIGETSLITKSSPFLKGNLFECYKFNHVYFSNRDC